MSRGIPYPDGVDESTRRVLEPMIEILEQREGIRDRTRKMNVTFQDLIDLGLLTEAQVDDHIA